MIKTLLINNNRSLLSNDLSEEIATRGSFNFLVATEPNVYSVARAHWVPDRNGDVAIRRVAGNMDYSLYHRGEGIVAIELCDMVIIAVYISPNCTLELFQHRIFCLQRIMMQSRKIVLVMGDFNYNTALAGAESTNTRGRITSYHRSA
ncbi:uncharacterized protein LOC142322737 [Lycorma delicatula]|uniref:uncharacterized protein LOC142322737 n=1 Tax=Lycorma delicatula TaxID=130591 RepID=UPI003F518968